MELLGGYYTVATQQYIISRPPAYVLAGHVAASPSFPVYMPGAVCSKACATSKAHCLHAQAKTHQPVVVYSWCPTWHISSIPPTACTGARPPGGHLQLQRK